MGFISPTNPLDEYPVIDPLYGIDGFRNVNLLSDLDNIPNLRRRAGMVVGVSGGTQYYKLNPEPWNSTISDWTLFQTGGGGGEPFTGGTVSGETIFTNGVTATTISASTYLGLPLDIYVTGGTYNDGVTTFINNTGGTFNVSGYYTGETDNNTFTTGFTYENNTFTIFDNSGNSFNATIDVVTGLTINGTLSASTYENLPLDIYVTGGTYNDGDAIFTNNTGGTFTVSGFYTGGTDFYVTGGTFDKNTETLTLSRNDNNDVQITGFTDVYTTGFTFDPSSYDISVELNDGNILTQNLSILSSDVTITGGTYDPLNGTATFTNNTGGTFNVTGFITGFTDIQVTGYTYQDNTFTIFDSSGNTFSATIDVVTGLTVNGTISATTYQNLPLGIYGTGLTFNTNNYDLSLDGQNGTLDTISLSILASDLTVTGGTYDPNTGIATFTNNTGGTFNVTGFLTGMTDTFVTGSTYNNNTFTFTNTSGGSFSVNFNTVTGLTSTGTISSNTISATTYQNLPDNVVGNYLPLSGGTVTGNTLFSQGLTASTISASTYQNLPVTADTFTTGFSYSNNTFTINRNQGQPNLTATIDTMSGLTVNGNLTTTTVSATTYQNLPINSTITGGTFSGGTITLTNSTGGTISITGLTTVPNLSKILFVDPNGNDSTGVRGNMNLPYLTLEAAKSASTTGDTIYVFPGTYTVTTTDTEGLAKDGIAYYFSPKTIINKATLGPIFYANGFVNGFNVYGYGNFNKTGLNGAIFSSNNISVYGSVLTASVNVVGAGYTTGIKTTTGGSGIGLVINVTAVGGGGTISTFTISNVGADYKVGDIIDVVQLGGSGGKIRIDSVVNNPDKDADVSFEANDLFASNAADPDPSPSTRTGVFYILNTARCNIKFNNLYISTTRLGFSINTSNVNVNMNSIVSVGGSLFVGPNGSLGGIGSSTLSVFGNLISAVGVNAQAFAMSSGGVGFINVQTINTPNTGAYSFGGNAATATFNVQTMGRIFGQAASTIYLNGYTSTIDGVLNLYGGVVGRINGIGGGTIQTAYGGLWSGNEAPTTMTISGGLITLEMQNQDTTTGFAISGGIVTLNGNWTNDDMGASSDLTGGTLIINGDYEYGGPFYLASRLYGINVAGGTLIVNGTMRVNSPSTTATYSLDASPIQFSSGKVIINGGTLISNVPQATPVRTVSANNSVTSIGSGVAGAGYTTGTKSTSGGTGTGLTLSVTNANGITNTTIVNRGSGYTVGNVITVLGGSSLATFVVTAVLEFKVYSAGMNTNLVQNGGTLAGKKKKIRVNIVAVINTQIQLNDNLGSGNIIFTANATTFPSLSQLAQALVTSINANAIQITASQDTPGSDPYFYLESDSADLGFTSSGGVNIGEIGLVPGMYPITPKVLGTIIEDVDVE